MRRTAPLLALLLALAHATAAQEVPAAPPLEPPPSNEPAPNEPKEDSINLFGSRFSIVAGVGILWPSRRDTREVYGSNHLSPSIAFWKFRSELGAAFSLDLSWRAYGNDDSGEPNIWGANAGFVYLTRDRTRDLIPYFALRAGPQLVKVPDRDLRFALGGTVEAGFVLWRRLIVSGRYDQMSHTAGVDLSSFSARIAVRLF